MNINRNNYEEFFLLYVDNELSAVERNAVELFVQENVDLKEELNMLLQTVVNADAVLFVNKPGLLKEEYTALQENLLLYIDNELSADQKLNTEKVLQADYSALKELGLLQQTKLQPETIVFAGKQSLYRKERGRVIDLPWRRIAAAAVLLGFGTWATISFIKNNTTEVSGVVSTAGESKTVVPKKADQTTTATLQQSSAAKTNQTAISADPLRSAKQKNNPIVNNKVQPSILQQKNTGVAIIEKEIKKPGNNLVKPYSENINSGERNKNNIADVTTVNTTAGKIIPEKNSPADVINENSNNGVVNGYALRANFTEGDADNDLSSDDKGKKTKLGGFFRKVKRLVERNTNVTTGNGIKVAGFDIAIK